MFKANRYLRYCFAVKFLFAIFASENQKQIKHKEMKKQTNIEILKNLVKTNKRDFVGIYTRHVVAHEVTDYSRADIVAFEVHDNGRHFCFIDSDWNRYSIDAFLHPEELAGQLLAIIADEQRKAEIAVKYFLEHGVVLIDRSLSIPFTLACDRFGADRWTSSFGVGKHGEEMERFDLGLVGDPCPLPAGAHVVEFK